MRRATAKAKPAPVAPAKPPALTSVPPGYEVLSFGSAFQPVKVEAGGYRELARPTAYGCFEERGAICATMAEALGIIEAHQAWIKGEAEWAKAEKRKAAAKARNGAK